MKVDLLFQNENNNLMTEFKKEFEKGMKKLYIFSSSIKQNGFDSLNDILDESKVELFVYMGIDKKNTTKKLIDDILNHTKNLYVYDNNEIVEFVSGIYILENKEEVNIYILNGSFSEDKIKNDYSIITKISYDLKDKEDKKLYKDKIKELLNVDSNKFTLVNDEVIQELMKNKKIFSNKQYVHSVKSISDYIGESKKEEKGEELPEVNLLDDDELDIDFDISIDEEIDNSKDEDNVVLEENLDSKLDEDIIETDEEDLELNSETLDLDNLLLEKADISLEVNDEEDENEEIDKKTKKLDLNNASNYIFQLPARQKNNKDKDMIKIPNYIRSLIPNFFDIDSGETKDIDGDSFKVINVNLSIIDAKNNVKYKDKDAYIMLKKGQTYFYFKSNQLTNLSYEENDIARIIKLSNNDYHIEIVSKELEEYKIWSRITNIKFKGNTERMYGVM